jgi:hypothetical protein
VKKNQSGKASQKNTSNQTAQGKQRPSTAEDANNDGKEVNNDSKRKLCNKQYWRKKRNSKKQGSNQGSP